MNRKTMVFFNVGWMKDYKGLKGDTIEGGGSYIKDQGYGGEIFNFLPFNTYVYGFVQSNGNINISRIGATEKDGSISNILVVWVSKNPSGGTYVIGWYKNATIYKSCQTAPRNSKRRFNGDIIDYNIKAKLEDAFLLPTDKRVLLVPRGKNGMGQANIWYADKAENHNFLTEVSNLIEKDILPPNHKPITIKNGKPWQPDPLKRQRVEAKAIEVVIEYYRGLGYEVDSRETDNLGWDLEATINKTTLKIEVKGLSHGNIFIELTPNEYEKMRTNEDCYRICIVTNTLNKDRRISVFSFSPDNKRWEDDDGNNLKINEITSARMSA